MSLKVVFQSLFATKMKWRELGATVCTVVGLLWCAQTVWGVPLHVGCTTQHWNARNTSMSYRTPWSSVDQRARCTQPIVPLSSITACRKIACPLRDRVWGSSKSQPVWWVRAGEEIILKAEYTCSSASTWSTYPCKGRGTQPKALVRKRDRTVCPVYHKEQG